MYLNDSCLPNVFKWKKAREIPLKYKLQILQIREHNRRKRKRMANKIHFFVVQKYVTKCPNGPQHSFKSPKMAVEENEYMETCKTHCFLEK